MRPALRLRDFCFGVRLAITILSLTIIGGSVASGVYLYKVKEKRDEREGLTIDDVRAHYHGLESKPPMLVALESGHPEDLPGRERQALIDWLKGDKLEENYDNFDLGDLAPEEIIIANCVSCHARSASGPDAAPQIPLQYFNEVRALSVGRTVNPVDEKILFASLHTHSLSLATLSVVVLGLLALTRLPGVVVGSVSVVTAAGLFADLASWVPARDHAWLVEVLVVGGAMYQGGLVLALVLVMLDVWWPKGQVKAG